MPEADTIERVKSRKVQVASLPPADSGRGFARLPDRLMDELGLAEGDVIEIVGKRSTAARAIRPYGEDEGIDIIRLDGLQRANAGVGSGDFVEVSKAASKPATRVVFAPAQPNVRLQGSADALKRTFAGRPLVEGDIVSTTGHQRVNADMPDHVRQMLNAPAFALQELRLVVVSAAPKGIVHIDGKTAVELLPEYTAVDGERRADVTYDDLGGMRDTIDGLREMVELPLRHPELFQRLGVDPPKGVLLHGPPGTGKTLLARATAGEANVPFFSASASEFIEMIVGVGASRVRELFAEARKVAPAIVFIDEIDTIGRARGGARAIGGHDEREQTLNQILTEMDGFSGHEGVVVLAATNRPDVLDPALLRPGRFDRTIMVHPPDSKGRAAILRVHTRKVPLAPDVDLDQLAASTPGMTGADLANLVNEAALAAARLGRDAVTQRDLNEALEKVQLGTARNLVIPEQDRRRTAYHEAGHALLGMLQPGADPVRKVSIIPRGRALGVTLSTPEQDRYGYEEPYLRGRIMGALGGMAAEHEVFGVITTGAESDLEVVTRNARSMVGRWGMSDRIGKLSVLPAEGDPRMAGVSDEMLNAIDEEVRRITDECYGDACRLLRENRHRLDRIVEQLLARETLEEAEVYAVADIERPAAPAHSAPALP